MNTPRVPARAVTAGFGALIGAAAGVLLIAAAELLFLEFDTVATILTVLTAASAGALAGAIIRPN